MFKQTDLQTNKIPTLKTIIPDVKGAVGVPILLYFLGVPGIFVLLIWFFLFKGN